VTKHGKVDDNNKFLRKIIFSDEAVFHNVCIWDENVLMLQRSTLDIQTKLLCSVA